MLWRRRYGASAALAAPWRQRSASRSHIGILMVSAPIPLLYKGGSGISFPKPKIGSLIAFGVFSKTSLKILVDNGMAQFPKGFVSISDTHIFESTCLLFI